MDRNNTGIPQGRKFPGNCPWGGKEGGAESPNKEEGNSSFLGIPGERGFRKKGTENGNAQPSMDHNMVL